MYRRIPREKLKGSNGKPKTNALFWEVAPTDDKDQAVFTTAPYHRLKDDKAEHGYVECYDSYEIDEKGGWYSLELLYKEYMDTSGVLLTEECLLNKKHFEQLKECYLRHVFPVWEQELEIYIRAKANAKIIQEAIRELEEDEFGKKEKFNLPAAKYVSEGGCHPKAIDKRNPKAKAAEQSREQMILDEQNRILASMDKSRLDA